MFVKETLAKYAVVAAYKIEDLTHQEYVTLQWLRDHGYDATIGDLPGEEKDDGGWKFDPIPEHRAWEVKDAIEEDQDAFLASNGSRSLGDKLLEFVDSIV